MSSAILGFMRYFAALVCLLSVTACDFWSPTEPQPVDVELTLAPGQTRSVNGTDVSIRFEAVVGDNRCPADAICILGGSADVRIQVRGPGGSAQPYELRTGDQRPVQHGGLRIELVEVTPYPFSSLPFDPADYRIKLRITRQG
jgi:hypothetical protein